jgi:hypothetical protein
MDDGSAERAAIGLELEGACQAFHELLATTGEEDFGWLSEGTRWTNRQLLFHMMSGYLVMRALLSLVKVVCRLPDSVGRSFAAGLNASTRPFNSINY